MRMTAALILFVFPILGCLPGCSDRQRMSGSTEIQAASHSDGGESQQPTSMPRIWTDDEAASMVKAVSGLSAPEDRVYVFRWEKGAVRGQVKLEVPDQSEPLAFDLSVPPDLTDTSGNGIVSGWITVAMRKVSETDGEVYDVRIDQQFTIGTGDEFKTVERGSRIGRLTRVPPDADPNHQEARTLAKHNSTRGWQLLKFQDGVAVPWFELNLDV